MVIERSFRAPHQAGHLGNGRYPRDELYGNGHAGERIAKVLAREPLRIDKRLLY